MYLNKGLLRTVFYTCQLRRVNYLAIEVSLGYISSKIFFFFKFRCRNWHFAFWPSLFKFLVQSTAVWRYNCRRTPSLKTISLLLFIYLFCVPFRIQVNWKFISQIVVCTSVELTLKFQYKFTLNIFGVVWCPSSSWAERTGSPMYAHLHVLIFLSCYRDSWLNAIADSLCERKKEGRRRACLTSKINPHCLIGQVLEDICRSISCGSSVADVILPLGGKFQMRHDGATILHTRWMSHSWWERYITVAGSSEPQCSFIP